MATKKADHEHVALRRETHPAPPDQRPRPERLAEPLPSPRGPERIIRKSALPVFTRLQRTAIDTLIKAGKFPKPVPLGERSKGWVESELIAWQQSLIAKRNGAGGGNGWRSRAQLPLNASAEAIVRTFR
jgi:prophage regulatory protein